MEIRKLYPTQWEQASALVWQVFQRFEAPEYPPQGVESFRAFLDDRQVLESLEAWAAWEGDDLVGVLASRDRGAHICLCFVREDCHKQGIGRALWLRFLQDTAAQRVTVHASPYGVGFYHKLGFRDTAAEQLQDGIRFIPMEFTR